MPDSDGDDYELMPRQEIEQLRREIASVKRGAAPASDMGNTAELYDAVRRLNNSINKLISILEDAQQDIVAEYQQAKPAEKLNQIMDQNETIAKAIISLNDSINNPSSTGQKMDVGSDDTDYQNNQQIFMPQQENTAQPAQQYAQRNVPPKMYPPPLQPVPSQFQQQGMPPGPDFQFKPIPPLDNPGLPPLPNQDPNVLPEHKKKKFLGLI